MSRSGRVKKKLEKVERMRLLDHNQIMHFEERIKELRRQRS
jgi:hypothetical protein